MRRNRIVVAICLVFLAISGCAKILEGKASGNLVQALSRTQSNFLESQQLRVMVEPDDLDLYRKVLPRQFDMPEHPMVVLVVVDYIDVGPWPLTRYQEGYIDIRCSYKGEEGWHSLTMPVNKWVAMYAGRTMGYPKYLADEITLEQSGEGWSGEVFHKDESLLLLEFDPGGWKEEPVHMMKEWEMGGPSFNLMPPGKGPDVKRVGWSDEGDSESTSTVEKGMVKIFIGQSEPWAGLVKPGTVAPGIYVHWKGGGSLDPDS